RARDGIGGLHARVYALAELLVRADQLDDRNVLRSLLGVCAPGLASADARRAPATPRLPHRCVLSAGDLRSRWQTLRSLRAQRSGLRARAARVFERSGASRRGEAIPAARRSRSAALRLGAHLRA